MAAGDGFRFHDIMAVNTHGYHLCWLNFHQTTWISDPSDSDWPRNRHFCREEQLLIVGIRCAIIYRYLWNHPIIAYSLLLYIYIHIISYMFILIIELYVCVYLIIYTYIYICVTTNLQSSYTPINSKASSMDSGAWARRWWRQNGAWEQLLEFEAVFSHWSSSFGYSCNQKRFF